MVIHFAETEDEVRVARDQYHMTPTAYLDSIGVLGPTTIGAHGVWVNDADIAILKKDGVGVAHNPESNMKLASGAAPVMKYLAAGVKLGLGTDGAASNNDLDMFEAMRQASFLAKHATHDPTAVKAQDALDMATIGGARVLGMEQITGSLEAGKRTDLITVSVSAARQTPLYDVVSHLVYVTKRRRCPQHDRERQGPDAESSCADARSGRSDCGREPIGGERQERRAAAVRRQGCRMPISGRLRYCSA